MGFAQTQPVAARRRTLVRRSPASGTPSARNAAKRNEHGFGVLARAQRSEHVRPSLESNPRGQQDGRLIEYVTDGKGRRIGKIVNGVLIKQWLYHDQFDPIAELDGAGNLVARYIYGPKTNIPAVVTRGTDTYRIISDQLGSPQLAVNVANSADIAFQAAYTAYGERVLVGGAEDWIMFGFAGGFYDPDTKVVRFGARDYFPQIGKWTAKDPARFGGGRNLYQYTLADPVNFRDQSGRNLLSAAHICAHIVFHVIYDFLKESFETEPGDPGPDCRAGQCVCPTPGSGSNMCDENPVCQGPPPPAPPEPPNDCSEQ